MWLVQRCKPTGTYEEGMMVSDYMNLDYMGSAEFEFGAIPQSIRRLAGKPNLVVKPIKYTNAKHHNFTYYILADEAEVEKAKKDIEAYISGKNGAGRLKEHIHFGPQIQESEFGSKSDYGFWWCIDEGGEKINFCFTFDAEQARCFKLALAASLKFMEKTRKEKVRTA